MRLATAMLEDADLLLGSGSRRSATSRAYFAVFHAARALLNTKGLELVRHQSIRAAMDREFVKSGKLDRSMGEIYHELYNWRTDADQRDFVNLPPAIARGLVARARAFVETIEEELTGGGWLDADPDPLPGSDTNG